MFRFGRDAGAEVVHAEEGCERLVDVGFNFVLDVLDDVQRTVQRTVAGLVARGEQLARGIEDRDVIDVEPRNGRGNEVADGGRRVAAGRGAGADHDGSRRLLFGFAEVADLGHDDVNACCGDAGDRLDRAADFAFERANPRHFLHERGQAERADVVEEFVARVGAVRQTALGEQEAGLAGHAGRNGDAGAVGSDLETDIRLGKRHADLVQIRRVEPDIKRFLSRFIDQKGRPQDERDGNDAQRQPTPASDSALAN